MIYCTLHSSLFSLERWKYNKYCSAWTKHLITLQHKLKKESMKNGKELSAERKFLSVIYKYLGGTNT
jgi:ribosomal protein L44E